MTINTIENNTITGSVKEINQEYGGIECTQAQFYTCLGCITLVIVVSLVMITRLIQTMILRINYINPKTLQLLKDEILNELNSD